MSEERDGRRSGLVGPAILIGLGVVFLLNNLGILTWSIWEVIFRLWPVLLIATGLDLLLGRRSVWGSLLALALTLGVLAAVLWLSGMGVGARPPGEEISQALGGATEAEVVIDPGVGTLHVEALPESANLIEGAVYMPQKEGLARDFTVDGERATLVLRTETTTFGPFDVFGGWSRSPSWDLGLTPAVPLRLKVDLGMGEADIDLTGLTMSDLDVETGLGQTTITLPEEGRFQARIQGAIGETVIRIPRDLGARISLDTGLAARRMPADYVCQEDVCTSPDYETADSRVDLEVSQAIGNLVVRESR